MCDALYFKSCLDFSADVFINWSCCFVQLVWKCILIPCLKYLSLDNKLYIFFMFLLWMDLEKQGDNTFIFLWHWYTRTPLRLKLVFLIFYYLSISPRFATSFCQSTLFTFIFTFWSCVLSTPNWILFFWPILDLSATFWCVFMLSQLLLQNIWWLKVA